MHLRLVESSPQKTNESQERPVILSLCRTEVLLRSFAAASITRVGNSVRTSEVLVRAGQVETMYVPIQILSWVADISQILGQA
jgi:hypothetical protein